MRKNNSTRNTSLTACVSILALLLLSFAAQQSATAQTASGNFQLSLEDGYTRYLEFDARTQTDGSATGQMTFSDEAPLSEQDPDGEPGREPSASLYVKAEFDGLVVNGNMAVMSGTVRDSNFMSYIGKRVLLVVEDNGDNRETPDKITWGIYKLTERGWTPADAELEDDNGAKLRWIATDAEREDDKGIPSHPSEAIDCQTFPLSAYAYVETERWAGDIRVGS
ncbi:MAG TPA: hypothetical protein VF658_11590 [Pyrinomonadaceae bacterium]|jgi:hypothetical protein